MFQKCSASKTSFTTWLETSHGAHCSCDLHVAVRFQYVCDLITKLCRQHVWVVQNHEKENVCIFAQGKTQHKECKTLNLAAVKHMTTQITTLLLNGR
jgi:hypothetical protein